MKSAVAAAALLVSLQVQTAVLLTPIELATSDHAAQPSVVVAPREGFVVTWQERETEANHLRFAVLDAKGVEVRRGLIQSGKDWFVNGADFPSLAVLDNGDWVSFWLQKTSPGTYSYEIRSVRSQDAGKTWDVPIVIHDDATETEHGFVSMAAAHGDQVRLVWFDGRQMAGADHDHEGAAEHMTLRSATLGRDGKLKDQREVDDFTCSCCQTDAVRGAGGTLIAYRDRNKDEVRDISVVMHSRKIWSKPATVHADNWTIAGCPVNGPALAARDDGFAVLWPTMASGEMQLKLALGDGKRFAAPIQLAGGTAELGRVDLANWGAGGFIATRVRQGGTATELVIDELDGHGTVVHSQTVASKVGGYPRLAQWADTALLVWAQAGDQAGSTRIGIARISAAPVAKPTEM